MIDLKNILRQWHVAQTRYGRKYGQIGKIVSGSRVYETDNGKWWVTYEDGTTDAVIYDGPRKPVHVIVQPNDDGDMEVVGLQVKKTLQSVGGDTEALAQLMGGGRHRHYIGSGNEDPVESRRFEPGLVHAQSGLIVYIEPFLYDYNGTEKRWSGGAKDLTSNRPSTTSYWAWVKVGVDPATNTAVATTGTEYALKSQLTDDTLDAINFDTSGYIPCGGVKLQQGQTASPVETDFAEARDFIYYFDPARPPAIGGTTPAAGTFTDITANRYALTASTTLVIAAGVVTATKGYHLIQSESGTSDDLDTISGMPARSYLIIQAAAGHTIAVKNGTGNVFLNGGADFSLSGDKTLLLYNDGTNISDVGAGGSGGSSPWTTDTNVVNLVTDTDNVTIGSATALAKLAVDGDTDEVQFLVQGNATQTSSLAVFEDSAGNDQVTISNVGAVVVNEAGNSTGGLRVEGDNDANLLNTYSPDDHVGIGTSAPDSRLMIVGRADEPQLAIKGHSTQNQPLVELRNSASTVLHKVTGAGNIEPGADNTYNIGSAGAREAQIWGVSFLGDKLGTRVKNTSGSTANANHVGYITYTAASGREYKTTTTANKDVPWCVVLVGGANNADIYVATTGVVTVELNANCSAGDFLATSTTAGRASVLTSMRPEVFAVALTANAGGAGGTCTACLYCGTRTVTLFDSNYLFEIINSSDTAFVATINGAPSTTSVTYNAPSSGNENAIVPGAASDILKMRIHNTTRGDYRVITAVNTTTNVITTVAKTDSWASGDTITIESPTVTTGQTYKMMELDFSQTTLFPDMMRRIIFMATYFDSTAGGQAAFIHPYETFGSAKRVPCREPVAALYHETVPPAIPVISRTFCVALDASGTGTAQLFMNILSYEMAVP